MLRKRARLWIGALFVCTLLSSGCLLATDALNPSLLIALGIDPATVLKPQGTVLVVFFNRTTASVTFNGYQTDDPNDLTVGTRTFGVTVDPSGNSNEALPCPTGGISLGLVGANFQVTNTGATVAAAGQAGGTAVAYTGSILREGVDYSCGDLIEFTISPVGQAQQGGQGAFVITGEVKRGR